MLSVRFWGVRGSIPSPGADTVYYGGNTTCLEIRADERLLIVDLGTGIRPLGDWLIANDLKEKGCIEADIFVSHTHWDHIMGFPLFIPIFIPETTLRIRGPVSFEEDSLKTIIENQLSYRYWPVRAGELAAKIEYSQLRETILESTHCAASGVCGSPLDLGGGLKVSSKFLNHPIFCLGYRFDYKGKSIVTIFDHEPFQNLFPTDPSAAGYNKEAAREGELAAIEENERVCRFFKDADLLIHDAQYTKEEYLTHRGWGHGSYEHAIDSAVKANVKKLVFFHHDPARTDEQLKKLENDYAGKISAETMMAREGLTITL